MSKFRWFLKGEIHPSNWENTQKNLTENFSNFVSKNFSNSNGANFTNSDSENLFSSDVGIFSNYYSEYLKFYEKEFIEL